MELPTDVLSIVSAYSKPLFRYRREYKEAMFALGITEWPAVKKLLYTDISDKVIAALTAYANAMTELSQAEKARWDITAFTVPDLEERYDQLVNNNRLIRENNRLRDKSYRELCVFMVGEEKVYWEKESSDTEEEYNYDYEEELDENGEPLLTNFQALLDE